MTHEFVLFLLLSLLLVGTINTSYQQANTFELTKPRIVDSFSQPLTSVAVNQRVMIAADLVNNFDFEQPFAFVISVTDPKGQKTQPQWLSATLQPQQRLTPSLSWIPSSDGTYIILIEVWNNAAEKEPLADPLEIMVTIDGSITIPKTASISTYQPKPIPEWIKNNARWWAAGQLTNDDFINGIKFLIQEKIINIPKSSLTSKPIPKFVDPTKDPKYYLNRYYNEPDYKDWFDKNYPEYTIEEAVELSFNKIPEWIRHNAEWWAKDLISEDEFVKGIEHLIKKQIIRI